MQEKQVKAVFDEIATRLDGAQPPWIFALIGIEVTEDGYVGRVSYQSNVDRDVMIGVFENMAKMLREDQGEPAKEA